MHKILIIFRKLDIIQLKNIIPSNFRGATTTVAIARALAPSPHLILLDEPFSGWTAALSGCGIICCMFSNHNIAVVMVTHDAEEDVYVR